MERAQQQRNRDFERLYSMSSMAEVFDRRRPFFPWAARLAAAKRLFSTVVGPSLAEDCIVSGVYGPKLVIGVRRRPAIAMLKSLEPYLLRTLNERTDGTRIVQVAYFVDPHLNRDGAIEEAPALVEPQLSDAERAAIADVSAGLEAGPLRDELERWMALAVSCGDDRSGATHES